MDWGVPDWRDKTQYPKKPSEFSHERWRWEFTRRLKEFRADAMQLIATSDPTVWGELKRAYFEKWGFWCALDPRKNDYDDFNLMCVPDGGVRMPRFDRQRREESYSVDVDPNEFAIIFDLDSPIPFQIDRAKEALIEQQIQFHGKKVGRRRTRKQWIGYLRALDAEEAGATRSEMVSVFFGDGILDRHKLAEGGYGPPDENAASKLLGQAVDLQSNFPD